MTETTRITTPFSFASTAAEVLAMLGPLSPQDELPLRGEETSFDRLSPPCRAVREAIGVREDVGVAELSARTGMSVPAVLAAADELGGVADRGPVARGALPGGSAPRQHLPHEV